MYVYISLHTFNFFFSLIFFKIETNKQARAIEHSQSTLNPRLVHLLFISSSNENHSEGWLLLCANLQFLTPLKGSPELYIHELNLSMSLTYLKPFQGFYCPPGQLFSITDCTKSSIWRWDDLDFSIFFLLNEHWNLKT